MTLTEAAKIIGKVGRIHVADSGLEVDVRVEDVKVAYGQVRYLVVPVSGQGSTWVYAKRVRLNA